MQAAALDSDEQGADVSSMGSFGRDLELLVGGTSVFTSRFVLCAQSPVFQAMLSHEKETCVEFPEKDAIEFRLFLDMIEHPILHPGKEFKLTTAKALPILELCFKYDVQHYLTACATFLETVDHSTLNTQQLVTYWSICSTHNITTTVFKEMLRRFAPIYKRVPYPTTQIFQRNELIQVLLSRQNGLQPFLTELSQHMSRSPAANLLRQHARHAHLKPMHSQLQTLGYCGDVHRSGGMEDDDQQQQQQQVRAAHMHLPDDDLWGQYCHLQVVDYLRQMEAERENEMQQQLYSREQQQQLQQQQH